MSKRERVTFRSWDGRRVSFFSRQPSGKKVVIEHKEKPKDKDNIEKVLWLFLFGTLIAFAINFRIMIAPLMIACIWFGRRATERKWWVK